MGEWRLVIAGFGLGNGGGLLLREQGEMGEYPGEY